MLYIYIYIDVCTSRHYAKMAFLYRNLLNKWKSSKVRRFCFNFLDLGEWHGFLVGNYPNISNFPDLGDLSITTGQIILIHDSLPEIIHLNKLTIIIHHL